MNIPKNQYELYAEFGIASEKAQVIEVEAGNVALSYLMLLRFTKPDQITPEITEFFRNIMNDINKKTLGQLLKVIRNQMSIDKFIEETLIKALEKRNYLFHHFFRTHNFAIFNELGRDKMISELKEIQNIFDEAHSMLNAMSSGLGKIAEFSPEEDFETIAKLMQEGKGVKI